MTEKVQRELRILCFPKKQDSTQNYSVECQLINTEGIIKLENNFLNSNAITDTGKSYQWMAGT